MCLKLTLGEGGSWRGEKKQKQLQSSQQSKQQINTNEQRKNLEKKNHDNLPGTEEGKPDFA